MNRINILVNMETEGLESIRRPQVLEYPRGVSRFILYLGNQKSYTLVLFKYPGTHTGSHTLSNSALLGTAAKAAKIECANGRAEPTRYE